MADRPLQPMVEFTPEACGEVRRALDQAIAAFRDWGIDFNRAMWVRDAAEELNRVAKVGVLPEATADLRRISSAAALAVDLYHISTCLGEEPNRQFAKELATLRNGKLLGTGSDAAGRDLLPQLWIGALLAQSDLSPHVVAYDVDGKSKPDFFIHKRKTRFGVEVKKPRSKDSMVRAVETAARQLRDFEGPGIIVTDATECMTIDPWGIADESDKIRDLARHEVADIHHKLVESVSPHRPPSRFSNLAMVMTYARYWNWIRYAPGKFRRDAGILFHADGFGYLWSVQITGLTKEIQDALLVGVEQLTGNPPSYAYKG